MNKENFEKAIKLNELLKKLNSLQHAIKHRADLRYVEVDTNGCYIVPCIGMIYDILDKHDAQIEQELEDKINEINKQIEEL
jgi:hydrogenase maturation factor